MFISRGYFLVGAQDLVDLLGHGLVLTEEVRVVVVFIVLWGEVVSREVVLGAGL